MTLDPHKKAWLVTVMLVVLGVASWINHVNDYEIAIPLFLFYAVLVINTHFSIILFSSLVPHENKVQTALDLILFALYVYLIVREEGLQWFFFYVTLLFCIASIKYTHLLNELDQPKLLKRKITWDALGILLGLVTLGGIMSGYVVTSLWFCSIAFLIANIYLLFINPLYKKDS